MRKLVYDAGQVTSFVLINKLISNFGCDIYCQNVSLLLTPSLAAWPTWDWTFFFLQQLIRFTSQGGKQKGKNRKISIQKSSNLAYQLDRNWWVQVMGPVNDWTPHPLRTWCRALKLTKGLFWANTRLDKKKKKKRENPILIKLYNASVPFPHQCLKMGCQVQSEGHLWIIASSKNEIKYYKWKNGTTFSSHLPVTAPYPQNIYFLHHLVYTRARCLIAAN